MQWHPIRPIVASTSSYGRILIWNINHTENWSAFAPDFVELEENIEYEEREDEFDIVDEEQVKKKKIEDEDEEVDILTNKKTIYSSDEDSSGEDDTLLFLPILPTETEKTRAVIASAKSTVESTPATATAQLATSENSVAPQQNSADSATSTTTTTPVATTVTTTSNNKRAGEDDTEVDTKRLRTESENDSK